MGTKKRIITIISVLCVILIGFVVGLSIGTKPKDEKKTKYETSFGAKFKLENMIYGEVQASVTVLKKDGTESKKYFTNNSESTQTNPATFRGTESEINLVAPYTGDSEKMTNKIDLEYAENVTAKSEYAVFEFVIKNSQDYSVDIKYINDEVDDTNVEIYILGVGDKIENLSNQNWGESKNSNGSVGKNSELILDTIISEERETTYVYVVFKAVCHDTNNGVDFSGNFVFNLRQI